MISLHALHLGGVALAVAVTLVSGQGRAEPVSGDRMEVTAGDTIIIDGFKTWLQGCDTPETTQAKCDVERQRGALAAERMRKLLRSGPVDVRWMRRVERYKRGLVRVYVNRRNVCQTLIEEGLAVASAGGQRIDWCAKSQAPRADTAPQ
jgi:endonuclease YncB( thermonuclease family)